ncbi:hypothetical protein ACF8E6_02575 [Pseudomonas sp. xss_1]|uniref:hypothetical protein n=1 Tax=Pseudomonas sp. xss_1 TaxID=3367214 RepID=UPI00370C3355
MSPDIEIELHKKYPKILGYINEDGSYRTRLWGFQCGDGWHQLIDTLCASIQARAEATGVEVQVTQVKEKFGALRFYIQGGDDHIAGMIDLGEELSSKICEVCGKPGQKKNTQGWLITRCDAHTPT